MIPSNVKILQQDDQSLLGFMEKAGFGLGRGGCLLRKEGLGE